jgi:hypothetical protein
MLIASFSAFDPIETLAAAFGRNAVVPSLIVLRDLRTLQTAPVRAFICHRAGIHAKTPRDGREALCSAKLEKSFAARHPPGRRVNAVAARLSWLVCNKDRNNHRKSNRQSESSSNSLDHRDPQMLAFDKFWLPRSW